MAAKKDGLAAPPPPDELGVDVMALYEDVMDSIQEQVRFLALLFRFPSVSATPFIVSVPAVHVGGAWRSDMYPSALRLLAGRVAVE